MGQAPFGRDDPGPVLPGRNMTQVLGMTTFQVGDPMAFLVLVIADDGPLRATVGVSAHAAPP